MAKIGEDLNGLHFGELKDPEIIYDNDQLRIVYDMTCLHVCFNRTF